MGVIITCVALLLIGSFVWLLWTLGLGFIVIGAGILIVVSIIIAAIVQLLGGY